MNAIDKVRIKGEAKIWYKDELNVFIVADKGRMNADNPGSDTPAMVFLTNAGHSNVVASATLDFAIDYGKVDNMQITIDLGEEEMKFIQEKREAVWDFLEGREC